MYKLNKLTELFNHKELNNIEKKSKAIIREHRTKIESIFNTFMGVTHKIDFRKDLKFHTQEDEFIKYIDADFLAEFNITEYNQLKKLEYNIDKSHKLIQIQIVLKELSSLSFAVQESITRYDAQISKILAKLFSKYKNMRNAFGTYDPKTKKIEINLLTCYFFCKREKLNLDNFLITTFTHELAHCYNHLGRDKDGIVWDTNEFFMSDDFIIEGLAQYYTMLYAQEIGIEDDFEKETELLGDVYQEYRDWKKYKKEVVYQAFILARTKKITGIDDFRRSLRQISKTLN